MKPDIDCWIAKPERKTNDGALTVVYVRVIDSCDEFVPRQQ